MTVFNDKAYAWMRDPEVAAQAATDLYELLHEKHAYLLPKGKPMLFESENATIYTALQQLFYKFRKVLPAEEFSLIRSRDPLTGERKFGVASCYVYDIDSQVYNVPLEGYAHWRLNCRKKGDRRAQTIVFHCLAVLLYASGQRFEDLCSAWDETSTLEMIHEALYRGDADQEDVERYVRRAVLSLANRGNGGIAQWMFALLRRYARLLIHKHIMTYLKINSTVKQEMSDLHRDLGVLQHTLQRRQGMSKKHIEELSQNSPTAEEIHSLKIACEKFSYERIGYPYDMTQFRIPEHQRNELKVHDESEIMPFDKLTEMWWSLDDFIGELNEHHLNTRYHHRGHYNPVWWRPLNGSKTLYDNRIELSRDIPTFPELFLKAMANAQFIARYLKARVVYPTAQEWAEPGELDFRFFYKGEHLAEIERRVNWLLTDNNYQKYTEFSDTLTKEFTHVYYRHESPVFYGAGTGPGVL